MKADERALARHAEESVKFLRREREANRPPNTIILVDTHSDSYNGQLMSVKGKGRFLTLSQLLSTWVAGEIRGEMSKSSTIARGWNKTVRLPNGKVPWTDLTPKTRGGWRVLVLLACGAATRVDDQWNEIRLLLQMYVVTPNFGGKLLMIVDNMS